MGGREWWGEGGLVKMIFRPRLVSFATYSYYNIIRIVMKAKHMQISQNGYRHDCRLYVLLGNCDLMKLIGDKKLSMITEKCYYFMRVTHPDLRKSSPKAQGTLYTSI